MLQSLLILNLILGADPEDSDDCEGALKACTILFRGQPLSIYEDQSIGRDDKENEVPAGGLQLTQGLFQPGSIYFTELIHDRPPRLQIDLIHGDRNLPGIGARLTEELRFRYPRHPIVMSLTMLNGQRFLNALRANPNVPDFLGVPSLRTLQEAFTTRLNFQKDSDGKMQLVEIEVETFRSPKPGLIWLNRWSEISRPEYRQWIKDGMKASILEENWETHQSNHSAPAADAP